MAHEAKRHGGGETHPEVGHVVGLPILFGVLGALLVLTIATVAATWFDLGRLNIWIALVIAVVKASLVVLYFMHLRYDKPFNAMILIISLSFVVLFIGLALTDTRSYLPEQIPGYAPAMQQIQAK